MNRSNNITNSRIIVWNQSDGPQITERMPAHGINWKWSAQWIIWRIIRTACYLYFQLRHSQCKVSFMYVHEVREIDNVIMLTVACCLQLIDRYYRCQTKSAKRWNRITSTKYLSIIILKSSIFVLPLIMSRPIISSFHYSSIIRSNMYRFTHLAYVAHLGIQLKDNHLCVWNTKINAFLWFPYREYNLVILDFLLI